MDWYLGVLKQYVVFTGRSRRQEYWMFVLINILIVFAIGVVEKLIGSDGVLSSLYSLAIFLPTLGVLVRRLHDSGRSGFWLLINLIPVIGFFVMLYFLVQDSQVGANEYGPNPKGIA